jgi:Leucine-rich repeat (LRR) protein
MNILKKTVLKYIFILLLLANLVACKKDEVQIAPTELKDIILPWAGEDKEDVTEFQVKLNADPLNEGEKGEWSILTGLVEEKVFFENKEKYNSIFHGMPGETYELVWAVTKNSKTVKSTVKVTFKPLKVVIENSGGWKTKLFLGATMYDKGRWTVEGNYARVEVTSSSPYVVPWTEANGIMFQAYARTNYKFTWTTWYGSKSATATYEIKTGDYLEAEALHDLQMGEESNDVTVDNNHHVTKIRNGRTAGMFKDTLRYPALQALTHLKKLSLGDSWGEFPVVIGDKYLELEELHFDHWDMESLPDNIGNLVKLKKMDFLNGSQGQSLSKLPESFGKLKSLETLELIGVGLKTLPESFSNLTNLKRIDLSFNIVQKFPKDIGNLTKLEFIRAASVEALPPSVSKLVSLKYWFMSTNAEHSVLPDDIGNLQALEMMDLSGSAYKVLPASFCNLKNLQTLTVGGLTELPEKFGNLKNLNTLIVSGSFKTVPDSFGELASLKHLRVGGALESLPESFGKLKNLTWLYLEHSKSFKYFPESFGQLPSLIELYCSDNKIESLPDGFFNLPKIQTIDFSYNRLKTPLSNFSKLSKTLGKLNLWDNGYSKEEADKLRVSSPGIRLVIN